MKSLHVCVQSLMCKLFCETTSCLCAIPDVQIVCDVCTFIVGLCKDFIVVDFSCFFPGIWSTLESCHDRRLVRRKFVLAGILSRPAGT